MIELIKNLLKKWSCLHKWKLYNRFSIRETAESKLPYETRDTLICENCGKIIRINL